MNADPHTPQRIARLTPLADVCKHIDAYVAQAAPREADLASGVGRVLAKDALAPSALPKAAIALRDGFAVQSELTLDAGPYAPIALAAPRINVGEALPASADAIALLDAINFRGEQAEATAPVSPGEGVLAAHGDVAAGTILRRAGHRLRPSDVAILVAAGVKSVSIRTPRIRISSARRPGDAIINSCLLLLTTAIHAAGGIAIPDPFGRPEPDNALRDETVDAVFIVGGTGSGRTDQSVVTLSRAGKVAFHGIGIAPGDTAAIGAAGDKPVLLIPGRVDAALACWLLLGSRMFGRLAGAMEEDTPLSARLTRKIASSIGLAEVIPVRLGDGKAEPLASAYLPLAGAGAGRWLGAGARRQRGISGRHRSHGEAAAMSKPKPEHAGADLLEAVRQAARQEQFLEVVSADEARQRFNTRLDLSPLAGETVALAAALARVLAHDIVAPLDVPPFDRSGVDGFALRASDTAGASDAAPRNLRLNSEVIACGHAPQIEVAAGTVTAIATGGVIPRGADAVVMIEQTELIEAAAPQIEIRRPVAAGTIHRLCRLRHRARRDPVAQRRADRVARDRHAGGLRHRQGRCGAKAESRRALDRR